MNAFPHPSRRGFSLVELMFAIAILGIGLIAIASVFPVAGLMQRRTFDTIESMDLERSAVQTLRALKIQKSKFAYNGGGNIQPLLPAIKNQNQSDHWLTLQNSKEYRPVNRALPTGRLWQPSGGNTVKSSQASSFWVPLIRDAESDPNTREWHIALFLLRRQEETTYSKSGSANRWANKKDPDWVPGVRNVAADRASPKQFTLGSPAEAAFIESGDPILDNRGIVYTVLRSSADGRVTVSGQIPLFPNDKDWPKVKTIWYGRAAEGGAPSPTMRIVTRPGDKIIEQ